MRIFEPQPDFASYDTFLFAVLGLASASEEIDKVLLSESAHLIANINGKHPHSCGEEIASDDDIVYALLGVLSLQSLLKDILARWQIPAQVNDSSLSKSLGFEQIDDLLR